VLKTHSLVKSKGKTKRGKEKKTIGATKKEHQRLKPK
jgi:hypothetical protein